MEIKDLQALYARHPQVRALKRVLTGEKNAVQLTGLQGSSAALAFAALKAVKQPSEAEDVAVLPPLLFVLNDAEEAGYFYHDMVQVLDEQQVLFFPSSFRRAVKFGQRDAASEILRTEVLSSLMMNDFFIVTYQIGRAHV